MTTERVIKVTTFGEPKHGFTTLIMPDTRKCDVATADLDAATLPSDLIEKAARWDAAMKGEAGVLVEQVDGLIRLAESHEHLQPYKSTEGNAGQRRLDEAKWALLKSFALASRPTGFTAEQVMLAVSREVSLAHVEGECGPWRALLIERIDTELSRLASAKQEPSGKVYDLHERVEEAVQAYKEYDGNCDDHPIIKEVSLSYDIFDRESGDCVDFHHGHGFPARVNWDVATNRWVDAKQPSCAGAEKSEADELPRSARVGTPAQDKSSGDGAEKSAKPCTVPSPDSPSKPSGTAAELLSSLSIAFANQDDSHFDQKYNGLRNLISALEHERNTLAEENAALRGHDQQSRLLRGEVEKKRLALKEAARLAQAGLDTDGAHHKQNYLYRILDLIDPENAMLVEDRGS